MFIVSLTYIKPLNEVDAFIDAHVEYLDAHYAAGDFLVSGKKVPRTGGVILMHCQNRAEVDAIITQDPFYIAGVASYEVIEFVPTKAAESISFLINPTE